MKHARVSKAQAGLAPAPTSPSGDAGQPLDVKLQAAVALHRQGQLDQAEVLYKEILLAQPRHFDALQLLATVAVQRNHAAQAIVLFDLALKIHPANASVLSNRGSALLSLSRPQDALDSCDRALQVMPDYAEALSNRGNALWALKRPEEALVSFDHALKIKPDYAEALSNRGAALRALNRHTEALDSYDRALRIRPAFAQALNNRGAALQDLNRHTEALANFVRAQEAQPDHAEAHVNEALCRLMLGEFLLGWQKYEWRWKKEPGLSAARNFVQPLWLGKESLEGKTILLHAEQGLGDTLQFCRYVQQVAALGARVVLEVQPVLKTLLQGLEAASLVLGRGEPLPDFDCHCPLLSLPLAFQADLSNISGAAYLHSEPQKRMQWQERLGTQTQPRVGLVWSGSTGHQNDHNRSLALQDMQSLLSEKADFYCLQKELRSEDQVTLQNTPGMHFLGDSLQDFSDTAALVDLMDLVITVDTSVAHLAGAMGKEVWLLLAYNPDWRWLLERSDSPWYESLRLFRQPAPGDWASVLGQVQAALKLRLSGMQRQPESAPAPIAAQKPPAMTVQALPARLTQALELHQQGRLDQAQVLYKEILQVQPQHFDALQLLAMTEAQKNNPAAARVLFEQALTVNPQHAGALNNYGNVLRALNRPEEALSSYDQALQSQPDDAQALGNRANVLHDLTRLDEALAGYEQALRIRPAFAEALRNRGNVLRELKRPEDALKSYDAALQTEPDNAESLANRGSALRDVGRFSEALMSYDRALAINPDQAPTLSNRSAVLGDLKRPVEALASCDQALRLAPDFAEALNNRGIALVALNRHAEALDSYDRALKLKPDYAEALSNRGAALRALNRHVEALDSCDRALEIRPDYADALSNRGAALRSMNRVSEALQSYGRSLEIQPDHVEAHVNEALCRLMLGEFLLGWQKYQWRWKKEPGLSAARNFVQPLWLGKEPLAGKTILLHAEQGLGDTLQFCRYVQQVAALGARVVLEVQPVLKTLLQGLEGASLVLGRGEPLPDFDCHCPLLSLPLAFQADLSNISGAAYLHSEPQKRMQWQERLGTQTQPRVGLVWSGSTGHQNDHNRSLALQDMQSLLSEKADFYCLQKELRSEDQVTLQKTPGMHFLGHSLNDFSDTAALVDLMDLVITVDTSVAHLAGAMGKDVWLLLAYSPDWRWLLERSDSPWYDSARLFRQSAPGDWTSVLGQVQAALKLRLSGMQRQPESAPAPIAAQKPPAMTVQALTARLTQALELHQQGRLDQAQVLYKEILQVQPQHFDALQLLAMTEAQKNNPAAARVLFEQALTVNPQHAGALNNYGNVLRALNRPEEALARYDKAIQVQPDYAQALMNRGNTLWELKRPDEALASYDLVLEIDPDNAEALGSRGSVLGSLKRTVQSLESFDRLLQIRPDDAQALINRGNVLLELKRPEDALQSLDRALQIGPDFPGALSHRGNALRALGRSGEALQSYDHALRIEPDFAEALSNRAAALQDLGCHAEALKSCARALQLEPGNAEAHWNEALCRLMLGEFEVGWQKYEWRWKKEPGLSIARNFPQPLWLGKEPLAGKTILLHAEQGLGDTLQFIRYAQQVAALGARVVLEVQPPLKALLQNLEGVAQVIGRGEPLPYFDYHCPLLSLPLAFKADLSNISGQSYLQSDPQKRAQWQERLGPSRGKRVGLVWSGSTGHQNDHNRSLSLQQIVPLIVSDQAQYYCLQKELRPEDQVTLQNTPGIHFLGDSLKDFSDTAAVVDLMDLVITVDTSVAHLAGAMGKEVWILLPFSPDWRWLLERNDSPWYASARLFRQPAAGDWASVLGQVQAALKGQPDLQPAPTSAPTPTLKPTLKPAVTTAQELAAQLAQAVDLHQRGQLDQAEVLYKKILSAQPGHFDALQLLATMAQQRKDPVMAMALFDQALKINPRHPSTLNNRGNALRDLNRPEEALLSYDQALRLQPDYAEVLLNRGAALRDLKRYPEALESYDRALRLQPDYDLALINRGNVLRALNRPLEALASYDRALELRPDDARVWSNRANALQDLKRPEEALQSFDRALQIQPAFAEALNNRGKAFWDLLRPADALESYERALQIKPDFAGAWGNRGGVLRDLMRHAEALTCFGRALQLEPDSAEAHWNEALCRLILGEFESGWQKYEWRWKKEPGLSAARNFSQPLWLGKEPLAGKIILLHAEQGLGDTLQFIRYAQQTAALGARVILEVQPALKELLQGLPGTSVVVGRGEALPDFDYHCPLLSLPLAFQADLSNISGQSYLQSDPQKRAQWQERLGPSRGKRVGLVWSGSTGHQNDHNRSLSLQQLVPLISDGVQYYCLQKELRPEDQVTLQKTPGIHFLGDSLKDFSDTAALVDLMDLVITVDTSVAHLAGAMGKGVWILLPFSPDWRWLLERSDSPWYDSARLFRQPAPGDWTSALGQVHAALLARLR